MAESFTNHGEKKEVAFWLLVVVKLKDHVLTGHFLCYVIKMKMCTQLFLLKL